MTIYIDAPDPVDDIDVAAVDRAITLGLLRDGQHVTREHLAEVLGCTHLEGKRPCRACAEGLN